MTQLKLVTPIHQAGLTLIELMVSLVIGLLLAIIASSTYLYSKQAYNAVSENSQMEENGRLALNLLTRNIQSAGHTLIALDASSSEPTAKKIFGCDHGMTKPKGATTLSDLETCLTSTPAGATQSSSISTFYQTDPNKTSGSSFQGVDCIGNSPVKILTTQMIGTSTVWEVRSHFFVATTMVGTPFGTTTMGQLNCAADSTGGAVAGSFESQPLIPGVHQIRARYFLGDASNEVAPPGKMKEAGELAADDWEKVVQVELCVLTKAIQSSGNDTGTSVTDCYGTSFIPPPSQSYRRFTSTVNLRNKSSPAS